MTLFELLYNDERKILLSMKKVKIFCISPCGYVYAEEYFIGDIPYHLLRKEVIDADYYENIIEIFVKWKVGKRNEKYYFARIIR